MKDIFSQEILDSKNDNDLVHVLKSDVISHTEDRRKLIVICVLVFSIICVFLFYGAEAFNHDDYLFFAKDVFFVIFSLFFLWYFITNLKEVKTSKWIALFLFTSLEVILLTEDFDHGSSMWALAFPIICVFLVGFKFGSIFSTIFFISVLLSDHFYGHDLDEGRHFLDLHFIVVYMLVMVVVLSYEFLRESTQKQFKEFSKKLVDSVRLLEQRKEEYQILMKNVVVGLLLLDENLIIQKNYSHSARYIFGVDDSLEDKNFFDFIKQKTFAGVALRIKKKLDEMVSASRKGVDAKDANSKDTNSENANSKEETGIEGFNLKVQIRDKNFKDQIKILSLSFSSVRLYNGTFQIMVRVKDITDREKLKSKLSVENAPKRKDMKIIEEALGSNKALFKIFLKMVGEKNEVLKELQVELVKRSKIENLNVAEVTDIVEQVFSITHALKGNASIAGFSTSADILHNVEVDLKKLDFSVFQGGKNAEDFTKSVLMAVEIIERIYRHFDDLSFIMDELFSFANEGSEGAHEKSMMDLDWLIDSTVMSYNATVEEKIKVHIDTKKFNSAILKKMKREQQTFVFDSIVQLVKNSLVHGFKQAEKLKIIPTITISDSLEIRDGKSICIIDYRDNGKGVDWKNVKDEKGKTMSFAKAQKRIFDANYSQSATVDTHAGNGLGMSMIKKSAEKIGVSMNIPPVEKGFALQFLLQCD